MLKTLSASLWVFDLTVAYVSTKRRYWEALSMKTQLSSWIEEKNNKFWIVVRKLRRRGRENRKDRM